MVYSTRAVQLLNNTICVNENREAVILLIYNKIILPFLCPLKRYRLQAATLLWQCIGYCDAFSTLNFDRLLSAEFRIAVFICENDDNTQIISL